MPVPRREGTIDGLLIELLGDAGEASVELRKAIAGPGGGAPAKLVAAVQYRQRNRFRLPAQEHFQLRTGLRGGRG